MRKFLLGAPRAIRSTTDIPGWWQEGRAIVKKAASGLSKNIKESDNSNNQNQLKEGYVNYNINDNIISKTKSNSGKEAIEFRI